MTTDARQLDWIDRLPDFAEKFIRHFDPDKPGSELDAEIVRDLIVGEFKRVQRRVSVEPASRLMSDIRTTSGRELVYKAAAETFPEEVHLLAHYGKFLYDEDTRFGESRVWLKRAFETQPTDSVIAHMLGMSYFRELNEILRASTPDQRTTDTTVRIDALHADAAESFTTCRVLNPNNGYGYVSHVDCLIRLIEDRFRLHKKYNAVAVVAEDRRLIAYLDEAYGVISRGAQYVPTDPMLARRRAQLLRLEGNRDQAIAIYRRLVTEAADRDSPGLRRRLAEVLYERALTFQNPGPRLADLREAAATIDRAIRDDPSSHDNVRIWFDCVRLDPKADRIFMTDRLESLFATSPDVLSAFYLQILYMVRGLDEQNPAALNQFRHYQRISARLSENLAYGSMIREWLGPDSSVLPRNFLPFDNASRSFDTSPLPRIKGYIKTIRPPTEGYMAIPPWDVEVFFSPRTKDRQFYETDVGKQATFVIAFTWEKPIAYDPELT